MTDSSSERDLGRVEGMLTGIQTQLTALSTRIDERDAAMLLRVDDAHHRINTVERKLYWITGAGAATALFFAKVDFTKIFAAFGSTAHAAGIM